MSTSGFLIIMNKQMPPMYGNVISRDHVSQILIIWNHLRMCYSANLVLVENEYEVSTDLPGNAKFGPQIT